MPGVSIQRRFLPIVPNLFAPWAGPSTSSLPAPVFRFVPSHALPQARCNMAKGSLAAYSPYGPRAAIAVM
jgi:hypothetical protein